MQYNGVWLTGESRQFSVEGGPGRGGLRGARLVVRGVTEGGTIVARGALEGGTDLAREATKGRHVGHMVARGPMTLGVIGCSEPLA